MDKGSELAEKPLTGDFPELLKKSPAKATKNPEKSAESSKINKEPLIIKNCNFIQSEKQLQNLF